MIKVGSDFSGVGAFNQALIRIGIDYEEIFACDMDKYARQTFCLNYGTENDLMLSKLDTLGKTTISAKDYSFYYPKNVYEREIPKESLDIYMTSPPCQSFSLAGKRMGKEDKRGVLFFNSLEFIQENKPRYFIFENVKGLLSHDKVDKTAEYGRTFQEWSNYLGGKSVNGVHTFFPYEDSVPYHIYFQVLNAKHYGIPQNRERIFIIGIRDDSDNNFQFPKPFLLTKRLKDVLESEVDEKYFLSDKMLSHLQKHSRSQDFIDEETENTNYITANYAKQSSDLQYLKIGAIRGRNPQNPLSRVSGLPTEQMLEINESGTSNALTTVQKDNVVVIPATTIVEYQLTGGKWDKTHEQSGRVYDKNGIAPTIHTMQGGNQEPKIFAPEVYQLNPSTESGGKQPYQHNRVYSTEGVMTTLDTDSGRKSVLIPTNNSKGYDIAEEEEDSINFSNPNSETRRGRVGHGVSQTLDTACNQGILTKKMTKQQIEKFNDLEVDENIAGCITHAIGRMGSSDEYISSVKRNAIITQRIRRLTPTEAFRLMDFNQEMIDKTIESKLISDSQLYKQAGNSICVGVLAAIIEKINL